MNTLVYSLVVGLVVLIGLFVVIVATRGKYGKAKEPNYQTFFIMGVVWFVLGLPLQNSGLWILGLVFLVLGIANKGAWKRARNKTSASKSERGINYLVALVSILALLLGAVTFISFP